MKMWAWSRISSFGFVGFIRRSPTVKVLLKRGESPVVSVSIIRRCIVENEAMLRVFGFWFLVFGMTWRFLLFSFYFRCYWVYIVLRGGRLLARIASTHPVGTSGEAGYTLGFGQDFHGLVLRVVVF